MSDKRQSLRACKRVVVKIGSALLTNDGRGLCVEGLDAWVAQIAALRADGREVVLVSSGAVAEGMTRLGWKERPDDLHKLQAAAAVGQMGLVQAYEQRFRTHNLQTAQILLGHDDISARDRYLNARGTLLTLLELGVVPVVNENDTVVTDEIRFGDNDTLAALVANLIDADTLVILTDQRGLFAEDPRKNPAAELISVADVADGKLDVMVGGSAGVLGRGGMLTKLRAARLASRSGANTVIVGGREGRVLDRVFAGEDLGTLLLSGQRPIAARKKWLAGQLQLRGKLQLDDGAVRVLRQQGRSLLPVGVVAVSGQFARGDLVMCVDAEGNEVARGLVNYNTEDARKLLGLSSARIAEALGYIAEPELIHRDNLLVS
ncbi:glutamate 5-kinase [Zhongshania aliphaticivorans]|uniref:Glutamate 5-kinase n=1 Tax=Zhongshania aliphaticivorans TaxID=1470434 RepID=A0A127M1T9_9GAMM|nr:glutamate 5-kinase [Zhongshania aliphaticivorans]AMO67208.1 glutamate 5-kinase [Zhongshania aliphaticivorans]